MIDTNAVIRKFLDDELAGLEGRIFCPRLPENTELPAISFFTRGGKSTPYIPPLISPSVQFDCWADNPIKARELYRALYDALQGIQNIAVTIDGTDYVILSAREEVQGVDLIDEIPGYFRTLTFFEVMIR